MRGLGSIIKTGNGQWAIGNLVLVPAVLLLTACPPSTPAPTPAGSFRSATRAELAEAERASAPTRYEIVRFNWRSDDGSLQISGNGAARTAPPDSVRIDMSASLGIGRATILLMGNDAQAQPAMLVDRILPDRYALWAMLGHLRAPADAATIERLDEQDRTVWRVTDARGRITLFEVRAGTLIGATREEQGRTTSQLRLTRNPDGTLARAQLTEFSRSLRLEVEVTGREASEPFAAETWHLR